MIALPRNGRAFLGQGFFLRSVETPLSLAESEIVPRFQINLLAAAPRKVHGVGYGFIAEEPGCCTPSAWPRRSAFSIIITFGQL